MNKKKYIALGAAAVLTAGVAVGAYLYNAAYVTIDGTRYSRELTALDLSGTQLSDADKLAKLSLLTELNLSNTGISGAEFDQIQQALPDCQITWTPIFQGKSYPAGTQSLRITSLTAEDVEALDDFPQLKTVIATDCQDYDNLVSLAQRRPECRVLYSVTLGDQSYHQDTTAAQLADGDTAQAETLIRYLPKLESILFTGKVPALEEIQALAAAHPQVAFDWEVTILGMDLTSNTEALDLSGMDLSSGAEVEAVLPYLPGLQTVILCNTAIPQEDILTLRTAYPEIDFIWDLTIGNVTVRTDAEEIDISGNVMTPEDIEALLPYFTGLKKVVMSNCGIDNESMDALNRRHEDIQFVWTVELGPIVKVRTDITSFIPFKYCVDFYQEDLYNLRYCTDIIALDLGHQQIYNCEFVAFMPNLKYLVLADTKVQDLTPLTGLTNLVYLEIFVTYLQDYEPLLTLTGLRDLNLSWTYGDYEIIAQMPWLERCWWGGHWHNWQVRQYLQEKCPNTQFEFDDPESTGSGWRTSKYYYEMRDTLGMFYMQ